MYKVSELAPVLMGSSLLVSSRNTIFGCKNELPLEIEKTLIFRGNSFYLRRSICNRESKNDKI